MAVKMTSSFLEADSDDDRIVLTGFIRPGRCPAGGLQPRRVHQSAGLDKEPLLRAPASLAWVPREFDFVDGHPYAADAVVSAPIPICQAMPDGATDITGLSTHKPAFHLKPNRRWLGRIGEEQGGPNGWPVRPIRNKLSNK